MTIKGDKSTEEFIKAITAKELKVTYKVARAPMNVGTIKVYVKDEAGKITRLNQARVAVRSGCEIVDINLSGVGVKGDLLIDYDFMPPRKIS